MDSGYLDNSFPGEAYTKSGLYSFRRKNFKPALTVGYQRDKRVKKADATRKNQKESKIEGNRNIISSNQFSYFNLDTNQDPSTYESVMQTLITLVQGDLYENEQFTELLEDYLLYLEDLVTTCQENEVEDEVEGSFFNFEPVNQRQEDIFMDLYKYKKIIDDFSVASSLQLSALNNFAYCLSYDNYTGILYSVFQKFFEYPNIRVNDYLSSYMDDVFINSVSSVEAPVVSSVQAPMDIPMDIGTGGKKKNSKPMTGGDCNLITIRDLFYVIKFLFEWSHDFNPHKKDPINKEIYLAVQNIWKQVVSILRIPNEERTYEKTLYNNFDSKITSGLLSEESYNQAICDSLLEICNDIVEEFYYLQVFVCKDNNVNLSIINERYANTRKFIYEDYIYVLSDDTPTDNVNNIPLGVYMQDASISKVSILLSNYKKTLYKAIDKDKFILNVDNLKNQDDTKFVSDNTLRPDKIFTLASLVDPATTGGYTKGTINSSGEYYINEGFMSSINDDDKKVKMMKLLKLANIYSINQLLCVWIDNKQFIKDCQLLDDGEKFNGVKFIVNNDNPNDFFEWRVGNLTITNIKNALENIVDLSNIQNLEKFQTIYKSYDNLNYTDTTTYNNLYRTAHTVMKNLDPTINQNMVDDSIRRNYFMTIISFFKSCGDEMQRLNCEFFNFMINGQLNYLNYLKEFIPKEQFIQIIPGEGEKDDMVELSSYIKGITKNVFLLTRDKILVGESLEKNTPVYSYLKTFHSDAFPEVAPNTENNSSAALIAVEKTGKTGVITNRKSIITTVDLDTETKKTKNEINILIGKIIIKSSFYFGDYFGDLSQKTSENLNELKRYNVILKTISMCLTYFDAGNPECHKIYLENLKMKVTQGLINYSCKGATEMIKNYIIKKSTSTVLNDDEIANEMFDISERIGNACTLVINELDSYTKIIENEINKIIVIPWNKGIHLEPVDYSELYESIKKVYGEYTSEIRLFQTQISGEMISQVQAYVPERQSRRNNQTTRLFLGTVPDLSDKIAKATDQLIDLQKQLSDGTKKIKKGLANQFSKAKNVVEKLLAEQQKQTKVSTTNFKSILVTLKNLFASARNGPAQGGGVSINKRRITKRKRNLHNIKRVNVKKETRKKDKKRYKRKSKRRRV